MFKEAEDEIQLTPGPTATKVLFQNVLFQSHKGRCFSYKVVFNGLFLSSKQPWRRNLYYGIRPAPLSSCRAKFIADLRDGDILRALNYTFGWPVSALYYPLVWR
jgi:hypothetical protein